jgi:hypothetical protein
VAACVAELINDATLPERARQVYKGLSRTNPGAKSPMSVETGQSGRLDVAVRRVERAMMLLEQRLARKVAEAGAQAGDLFDQDRTQLAADLDHCRARVRELEEAGAQASAALDAAIAEVRAAMAERVAGP